LVYTPPRARRHGYAAAATEAVTRAAFDHGAAEIVLLTDVGNATSNAIYQRLGYRPVHDRVGLAFIDPAAESLPAVNVQRLQDEYGRIDRRPIWTTERDRQVWPPLRS
jgi:RimJ/RimL family protein N-acetyltransferase